MVERLNYWLLTSEYPPFFGGGISTYCYETANMLAKRGHLVTIFTQDHSISAIKETSQEGKRVIRFNPDSFLTFSFLGYEANLSFAFAETVKSYIKKEGKPDVIESQEYKGIAYYLLQFKYMRYPLFHDLKIFITLHSPSFLYLEFNQEIYYRFPYFWTTEMEKFCITAADILISPSQYLAEEIKRRMNLTHLKVEIINNPYHVNLLPEIPGYKANKIVFFGKLTVQKGCLLLIDYFIELWNQGFPYPLIMIGNGSNIYPPEGIAMSDFISEKYKLLVHKGLLQLTGGMPPDQLFHFLSDADIVIVPSLTDNQPYTVIEAMAKGRIVLASVQGGQNEIIFNGVNGFLFDHNEQASFQDQLKKIINLKKEDWSEISVNAYKTIIQEFNPEKIYTKKINVIHNLLKKGTTGQFPFIRQSQKFHAPIRENQSDNNLLSIVVPYYNMGKFVEETLASIRKAEYKNIEIILVNDGSSEIRSVSLLPVLEKKYNIRIIHQPNRGLACARNAGAKAASGTYLAFLDPDDTIEPSYYTKALKVLKFYSNVYFVGCWAKYFGDADHYWPAFTPEPPYLLYHNCINSSALVYKKSAFLQAGLNDKAMVFGMEDYESVIHLVKLGYQGVVLPEHLWNYRSRKNSMARSFTTNKKLYLYRLISQKHSDFYNLYAYDLFNLLNANGPGIHIDNPTLIHDELASTSLYRAFRYKLKRKLKTFPIFIKLVSFIKNK